MISIAKYGPWAVIPGGSEAIGAAFARKLGEAGFNVVLIARKVEPLEKVAGEVRAMNVQVRTLALDLTRADMLDRIREATDDIDVGLLIYNAGGAERTGPLHKESLEFALRVTRLNPIGQLSLTHHFGKKMVARGRGGILLIGSLAGGAGGAGAVAYCASKAFTYVLAEGLWSELKPHGIDVSCIVLGAVESPSMERLGIKYSEGIASKPDDAAQFALDSITHGPVVAPPGVSETFDKLRAMPRSQAAETMSTVLRAVTPDAQSSSVESAREQPS
jgi:short-subunit dehydrogenase